jgi:hypothetical protein
MRFEILFEPGSLIEPAARRSGGKSSVFIVCKQGVIVKGAEAYLDLPGRM